MTRLLSLLAIQALALWPAAFAQDPEDPPNHANSTVPYTTPSTPKYNYAEVIHKSLLFYHAQRSGPLGSNRRLAWRGDSCMNCYGNYGEDLRGGYYEAANTMKWGLPLAWTVTQLAFNIHAFPDGFKSVNEASFGWDEALDGVKWGADYLANCIANKDQFVGQLGVSAVGSTDVDFGYFGPPEEYDTWVPLHLTHTDGIAYINSSNPSSEILGETAATLAATSVIFKEKDQDYSNKMLDHAKDLYTRAITYPGTYMKSTHPNLKTVKEWYPSSIYTDELGWAAAWLYVATGDESYRTQSDAWIQKSLDHSDEYSWDEKLPGIYALMFMHTKNETYKRGLVGYMDDYWPGGSVKQTAKGLAFLGSWGSLGYASATGFLMMVYAKTVGWTDTGSNTTHAISFAAQQINYILGDCGRSWVVGFGDNSPIRPYHKSSYNSFIDYPLRGKDNGVQGDDFLNSKTVNRFILYGALEGGPAWDDTFKDDRSSYEYTDKCIF
ncbi:endoglucanase [Ceratobasidium sp. AG-Ba]|nr:endoglucanase [Ceratobasidium sp. AG-Ba]